MTIIAKQFGFTNGAGAIANLVDGSFATFYQPLATNFAAYTAQFFLSDKVTLNVGAAFPALEFDMGVATRLPQVLLKVETILTLGPSILIGSDVGATSTADTLQEGDVLLAEYTATQMCSNHFLDVPVMRDTDVRKRYFRFLQRSNDPAVAAPTPGPLNSVTYDEGEGDWEVVSYASTLTIETWGGGASGGVSGAAQDGGDTVAGIDGVWTQTSLGGNKASQASPNAGTGAGTGGTSSGANTINTTGGDGTTPTPTSSAAGQSGAGGDAPNGGVGGAPIFQVFELGRNYYYGNDGQAPGAGGGGHSMWYPAGDAIFSKYPGGGAGGYSKHVVALGSGDAEPGSFIGWSVGNGGVSSNGDGRGAQGRVRFSWT